MYVPPILKPKWGSILSRNITTKQKRRSCHALANCAILTIPLPGELNPRVEQQVNWRLLIPRLRHNFILLFERASMVPFYVNVSTFHQATYHRPTQQIHYERTCTRTEWSAAKLLSLRMNEPFHVASMSGRHRSGPRVREAASRKTPPDPTDIRVAH